MFLGVPIVMACYVLVNVVFFASLSYEQILFADTVALVKFVLCLNKKDERFCCVLHSHLERSP